MTVTCKDLVANFEDYKPVISRLDYDMQLPLLKAAIFCKEYGILDFFLDNKFNVDQARNYDQSTLFQYAAAYGDTTSLAKLLPHGDINLRSTNTNSTTLHSAASANIETIDWVMKHSNATIDVVDLSGNQPLHFAAAVANRDALANILSSSNEEHFATKAFKIAQIKVQGNFPVAIHLIDVYHADVNAANYRGTTALHTASAKGHLAVINVLADKGANLNAPDNIGATPIDYAFFHTFLNPSDADQTNECFISSAHRLLKLGAIPVTNVIDEARECIKKTIKEFSNLTFSQEMCRQIRDVCDQITTLECKEQKILGICEYEIKQEL